MSEKKEKERGQNHWSGAHHFGDFVQTRAFGVCLALVSLAAIFFYGFFFSAFREYLYSDMLGFWLRAMERLNGDTYNLTQYLAWPPGYHIFLAEFFRVLRWLGLEGLIKVETVLFMNMLAYAASVYAMQRILTRWFQSPRWMLAALLLYAFGFPALYFNVFLLSGNLAVPLLILAIALLYCREGWPSLIAAALLFSLTAIFRPSLAPLGLAFVVYFLVRWRLNRAFLVRAAVFSAIFFALVFAAGLEVSRISQGKVTGLSANGGLDFFIANSRYNSVGLHYEGWHHVIVVPALSDNPENGYFKTDIPFYEQDYYFKMGWNFIKHDPARLLKNVEHIRDLFFSPMLPSQDTPGYFFLRPLWDVFKFIMFLSLGLYIWMWRGLSSEAKPLFAFSMTVIGVTILVSYLFTGEPRYTYQIIFVFYLLFFKLAEQFTSEWGRWKKVWRPYALMMGGIVVAAVAVAYWMKPVYPPSMRMEIQAQSEQPQSVSASEHQVGRLFFPFRMKESVSHADLGYKLGSPARVLTQSRLDVEGSGPLPVTFEVITDWPFEILINGKKLPVETNPFYAIEFKAATILYPGHYALEVAFDYPMRDGGFAIKYNYLDAEGWLQRKTLGVSDTRLRFSLPQANESDS